MPERQRSYTDPETGTRVIVIDRKAVGVGSSIGWALVWLTLLVVLLGIYTPLGPYVSMHIAEYMRANM